MPINETGHARNIANLETLITFIAGWGAPYNPTNNDISLASLQTLLTEANFAMDGVGTALAQTKAAINDREDAFATLRPLVSRVLNYYVSAGAAKNDIDDVKTFKRKLDGKRKTPAIPDDPNTPEDESEGSHSASQQSYVQLVEHFDNIINLLKLDPLYDPNENALKTTTLEAISADLKVKNTAVISNLVNLSTSRLYRNAQLYQAGNGLVARAGLVKKYVKAAFGADSGEYGQIKGLKFTSPRN